MLMENSIFKNPSNEWVIQQQFFFTFWVNMEMSTRLYRSECACRIMKECVLFVIGLNRKSFECNGFAHPFELVCKENLK